jgi:thioredoxin-like negative regulator of GroEL
MTSMLLATIVQAAILGTGAEAASEAKETYDVAQRTTTETGKPMVVMVTTDWCAPCQTMKKTVLPRIREHGLLRKVAFAIVNPDRERKLAEELIGEGPIPQLVMFRKKGDGWVRKNLVGGQSVETVEEFIKEGLASDAAERKPAREGKKKDKVPGEKATVQHDGAAADDGSRQHG